MTSKEIIKELIKLEVLLEGIDIKKIKPMKNGGLNITIKEDE